MTNPGRARLHRPAAAAPLLAELRLHRAQLAALLAQLDPSDDNQPATIYQLPEGAA